MRLHILGRSAGIPGPGGGCAGYLVEAGGRRLMLDCGPGTIGRLQTVCDLDDLDAVLLSHLHMDHCFDLFPLAYGLMMRATTTEPERRLKRVPVHLPSGTGEALAAISAALGHAAWTFPPVEPASPAYRALRELLAKEPDFALALLPRCEYPVPGGFEIAGIRILTRPARHNPPTAILRIEADGHVLASSGDTAATPELVAVARGADLFLCEATKTAADLGSYDAHLSPASAGRFAAAAGVGRLVLTHLWPWGDDERVRAEAAAEFPGPVAVAREGDVFEVGAPAGGAFA